METEKGKFDKIIDILFPLDMSYFFEIRRMETSIKVMIVAFLFVGFIVKSMDVIERLNIQDLTLSMMCVIMVVSCIVFFLLYMAVIYVVNLVWDVIIMAIKSRTKKAESVVHSEEPAVNLVENTSLTDVCEEESAPKVQAAEAQEKCTVKVPKTKPFIINLPDPTILENYIKSHADTYSNGDGAAILFDVLLKKEVIKNNQTAFCEWLNGLVKSVSHSGLSEALKRVLLKKSEGEDDIVEKYDELFNEIIKYII